MSANKQTIYNDYIAPLMPLFEKKGILVMEYNWEEIQERFPKFATINLFMDDFMDTNFIYIDRPATLTTEQVAIMGVFEEAETEEEVRHACNLMLATIIELVMMYYQEIKGYNSFQMRALEDVCEKEINKLYEETIQVVCKKFSTN